MALDTSPLSSSASPPLALAFLAVKGARDVRLGICYLVLGYRKGISALRVLMMAHAGTGAMDTVVVCRYGLEKKAWGVMGLGRRGWLCFW